MGLLIVNWVCSHSNFHFCVIYRLTDQYEQASLHLWELLEGRDKAVAGTTCNLFLFVCS